MSQKPRVLIVDDEPDVVANWREVPNIVIQGESGTGKELITRAIHATSSRASEVFVPLDCAAIQGRSAIRWRADEDA